MDRSSTDSFRSTEAAPLLYNFQAVIHAMPARARLSEAVCLDGLQLVAIPAGRELSQQPFAVSFEQAVDTLGTLPRMFIEPDGSFVWVGTEPRNWQVDGVLYDRDDKLLYVEVKGCCPAAQFDQLLSAFGWPAAPLLFQLTQAAVFVDEAEFRRWAARHSA